MPNPSELERQRQEENVRLGCPAGEYTGFEDYTDREVAEALRQQIWQSPLNEEAARRLERSNGR